MKKLSIILACALVALAACTKSKEVHPEIGDGNDEIVTVGVKDVHVEYTRTDHAELQKVVFHYSLTEAQQFVAAEMTKRETFFELTLNDLLSDTLYCYYYELFPNGGSAFQSSQKTFHTQAFDMPEPPTPPTPPDTLPEGAVNGLFTVNENGDKVYFSQGNLQYQASTNTWRFAEHQWDYVGGNWLGVVYGNVLENGVHCDNNLISSTYDGWIDLFCWGTSGYNHGAVCYQPWSISEENSDYYAYGNPTYNLNDQTGQADWGYNAISNGGNTENIWRTLTIDEWHYVLYSRTTTTDIRFAKANVCGINGVILFPDNWDGSMYSVNNSNIGDADYSGNLISNSDWVTIFDTHGAVFMPVTGSRLLHSSTSFSQGMYWSATYRYSDAINIMYFDPTYLGTNIDNGHRHDAESVRLVQDAR